ncbi:unnamed protein product [Urochloa decumbens]|uniref:Uncharacterized protein n=1 Tax=Urochloa decumbens TaxID=240449 RepID=A0ABC8WSG6_9POAL
MIFHEVLRLYPPFVTISRKTYEGVEIGGVTYPAGVVVDLPVLLIHHDAAVWGSDVHEFRPRSSRSAGAAHLRRPELRDARGQDGAEHDPPAVRVRARAVVHPRAAYRDHVITLQPMHGAQIKLKAI